LEPFVAHGLCPRNTKIDTSKPSAIYSLDFMMKTVMEIGVAVHIVETMYFSTFAKRLQGSIENFHVQDFFCL
jgi:hypothetical protein